MLSEFKFILKTETYAGIGSRNKIKNVIHENNYNAVWIIVDSALIKFQPYLEVINQLKTDKVFKGVISSRSNMEPDYDYLDQIAAELFNKQIDFIIAIGGGSTLDLAKAVAVLIANGGYGIEYRGFDKVKKPGVPVLAIPSTAGTGSEVTVNAVFTDKSEMRKLGINGRYMNATYAILDPEFTISAPLHVAVSSGMDALVHTLESFVGPKANLFTRMFAKEAFKLLYHHLPAIIDEPTNLDRRLKIQLGAYYAAVSLFNSNSGIAGAISYPLGAYYNVPHGIAGGMFVVPVVKYNIDAGYYKYAELYDLIEGADQRLSAEQKSKEFLVLLDKLSEKLTVPKKLSIFGIKKENYEHVIEIMQLLQAAFDQNPVHLDVKNTGIILDSFFE